MPVNIHISGENAGEALKELSAFAAHLFGGQALVGASAAETPKVEKPARTDRAAAKKEVEAAKKETAVAADPDPADEQPEEPVETIQLPTVVELRAQAAEVGKTAQGKAAVKGLLDQFESKSISDVPEVKRLAFLKALEDLA